MHVVLVLVAEGEGEEDEPGNVAACGECSGEDEDEDRASLLFLLLLVELKSACNFAESRFWDWLVVVVPLLHTPDFRCELEREREVEERVEDVEGAWETRLDNAGEGGARRLGVRDADSGLRSYTAKQSVQFPASIG